MDRRDFNLKHPRACIEGMKMKEKYLAYQDEYRKNHGVFPELDKINNPFTAKFDDVYSFACELRKAGIAGKLYYHDLHSRFKRKLVTVYENYSYEWSLFVTTSFNYRETIAEILEMTPEERISGNLGYKKYENGNYYEGTWKDGKLIYGLIYLAKSDTIFVGSFDESGSKNCSGVRFQRSCGKNLTLKSSMSKSDFVDSYALGEFRYKNGALRLYESTALVYSTKVKNNDPRKIVATVGKYRDGYEEGTFILKEISPSGIAIRWDKYREGDSKVGMSGLEYLPRVLLMCYFSIMWCLPKYVMGSAFFVTPIYYILKKKNWRL